MYPASITKIMTTLFWWKTAIWTMNMLSEIVYDLEEGSSSIWYPAERR